jgi:hypothetical protein
MGTVPAWVNDHMRANYLRAKYRATPCWANRKHMIEIYKHAKAIGKHVDHIVPLNSPIVCGLHCEFNFQLVDKEYNYQKGNHHWPDMPDERRELIPLKECEQYAFPL